MNTEPIELHTEKNAVPRSLLNLPGNIITHKVSEKITRLYISDSGNNRIIIANCSGKIVDGIGSGKEGHEDGNFESAEFFNPQGIAHDGGNNLYIADMDNNLIRKANLSERTVETIAGTGKSGCRDDTADKATFNGPAGITYANDRLFVTDRNNQMIRVINLRQGHVYTLQFQGIEKLDGEVMENTDLEYDERITIPVINAGFIDNLVINLDLPPNHKLNSGAPSVAWLFNPNNKMPSKMDLFLQEEKGPMHFNISGSYMSYPVNAEFNVEFLNVGVKLYYCKEDDERLCYIKQVLFEVPLTGGSGSEDVILNYSIE